MQTKNRFGIEPGQVVQIRTLKHGAAPSAAATGTVTSQDEKVVTVVVAESFAAGAVVGIETPAALILAEIADDCRWGTGVQVNFNIRQVIPFRSDLHNLMVAANAYGSGQIREARPHTRAH